MGIQTRNDIVQQFIQMLINSGHKYQYVKAVILQGLSKYVHMVYRDSLPKNDKKYLPMHRSRTFDMKRRKLLKYTEQATWFTNMKLGDKFKNEWKGWINTKERRRLKGSNNKKIKK